VTLRTRLSSLYPDTSGRRLKQWLEGGRVRVNGEVVRRGDVSVGATDRVELGVPPPPPFPALLRLVHEDDDLLVIDKPPGLLTISTESERERTAYRLLRDWLDARGAGRIFVVHRLDRETPGLVVFARTGAAKEALRRRSSRRASPSACTWRAWRGGSATRRARWSHACTRTAGSACAPRAAARRDGSRSRATGSSRGSPTRRCSSSR
jgi:23S rRNA-/tRNA-specific pseudouridylate synthase